MKNNIEAFFMKVPAGSFTDSLRSSCQAPTDSPPPSLRSSGQAPAKIPSPALSPPSPDSWAQRKLVPEVGRSW